MAQRLDKLTPDAFVRRQWIQTQFCSGSWLMTCLLLLESPTAEPHGDASRYPFGIPAEVTELAGVWDGPRVLWLYLYSSEEDAIAVWLRCGALQGSPFPEHRS